MGEVAIRVEGVGKQYRIGGRGEADTLRDALAGAASASLRAFRPLARRRNAERAAASLIWALKGVSFEVRRGEVLGLIGRNGAGKSTLLKILSRITEPTEGRARISGRVGSLLEVGTGFHPELSGRENIYLNGAILGMKKAEIERNFDEMVAFAEVEKFIDTPVKHYSSGMYLRLAFAVAAHLEPEILLVDEVLAVGDVAFQQKCLGKMGSIASEGRTVVFVSHNIPAIRTLCGRAILLDQGRVERDGDAARVTQFYLMGKTRGSKRTWEGEARPGNHAFRLDSVRLLDSAGAEVSSINISEDLYVEISYEVFERGASPGFSLILFDSEGNCLFGSLNNTEKRYYGRAVPPGRYKSTCRLYGNLLNAGRFYFSVVGFSANWTDSFRADQVVFFDAVDDGILRGDYYGAFGGVFRPKLDWETEARPAGGG